MFDRSSPSPRPASVRLAALALAALAALPFRAAAQATPRFDIDCTERPAQQGRIRLIDVAPQFNISSVAKRLDVSVFWALELAKDEIIITDERATVRLTFPNGAIRQETRSGNLRVSPEEVVPPGTNRTGLVSLEGPFPGDAASIETTVQATLAQGTLRTCIQQRQTSKLAIPPEAREAGPVPATRRR